MTRGFVSERKCELLVYERDDIMVSITDQGVVVTEKNGGQYETSLLRVDGGPGRMTVDGPTWGDAAKGHKAMIGNPI